MRYRNIFGLLFVAVVATVALAQPVLAQVDTASPPAKDLMTWHGYEVVAGEALVQFVEDTPVAAEQALHDDLGVEVLEYTADNLNLVRIPDGMSLDDIIALYEGYEVVAFAQPNAVHRPLYTPNDPKKGSQWGLNAVDAYLAFDIHKGNPSAVVAVIDTGVRNTHEDLNDAIAWQYDYYNEDGNAWDNAGHGTHTSGIASAETDNGKGVVGYGFNTMLACYRCGDGVFYSNDLIQAINDAKVKGALVLSMSWGSTYKDGAIESALNSAYNAGCVNVAAAGNNGNTTRFYPAALANVIGVASFSSGGGRSGWSNYGSWVDIAAPGASIYSTYYNSNSSYAYMDGTSMACPCAAGAAVLGYSYMGGTRSKANSDIIRAALQDSAVPVSWVAYGKLDMDDFLNLLTGGGGGSCPGDCVEPDNYGTGTAGSGGFVPHMTYRADLGCPYIGNHNFTLRVENALGGAYGVFFLGFDQANIDGGGWTLLVDIVPIGLALPITYSGSGAGAGVFEISFDIPNNPYITGLELFTQGTAADVGAPHGVAASEGLHSVICDPNG